MKVLIADDDTIIRVVLKRHLTKWGYEVVQARDGYEAWETNSGESPPQVAILDWMIPEIEGVEKRKGRYHNAAYRLSHPHPSSPKRSE